MFHDIMRKVLLVWLQKAASEKCNLNPVMCKQRKKRQMQKKRDNPLQSHDVP